jgi:uncharacterized protein YodC (DUF2158 family)
MRFAVGEVVTLKSGSPRLTIIKIAGDVVSCTYFRDGQSHACDFPSAALEPLIDPTPQSSFWARWFGENGHLSVRTTR